MSTTESAFDGLASDDDAALGEEEFLADLSEDIPLGAVRSGDGGSDEFGSDVRFREGLFVHVLGPRLGEKGRFSQIPPELLKNSNRISNGGQGEVRDFSSKLETVIHGESSLAFHDFMDAA